MTILARTANRAASAREIDPVRTVPTSHLVVGLAFGAAGALLLAVGAIGLPAALFTVSHGYDGARGAQAAVDGGLRVAPIAAFAGLFHLVAAAGLVTGRSWGRAVGMLLASVALTAGFVAMILVGAATPVSGVPGQVASSAFGSVAAVIFVVLAYAIGLLGVALRRAH